MVDRAIFCPGANRGFFLEGGGGAIYDLVARHEPATRGPRFVLAIGGRR